MSLTRSQLCKKLQDVGLTYREARKVVSIIVQALTTAVKDGKAVDLPFGTMSLVEAKPKRSYRFGKIVKTHTKPKVHFRRKD